MTANAFADDVKACRDARMGEFLAKPVRKKELIETMEKALKMSATDASPIVLAPPLGPDQADANGASSVTANATAGS